MIEVENYFLLKMATLTVVGLNLMWMVQFTIVVSMFLVVEFCGVRICNGLLGFSKSCFGA